MMHIVPPNHLILKASGEIQLTMGKFVDEATFQLYKTIGINTSYPQRTLHVFHEINQTVDTSQALQVLVTLE